MAVESRCTNECFVEPNYQARSLVINSPGQVLKVAPRYNYGVKKNSLAVKSEYFRKLSRVASYSLVKPTRSLIDSMTIQWLFKITNLFFNTYKITWNEFRWLNFSVWLERGIKKEANTVVFFHHNDNTVSNYIKMKIM